MFDKGATGGVTSLRPRLMEINVGPDLTAHPGWEDELKIHSDMMAEVAGLLGSRMQPVPGLSAVQKEMQQGDKVAVEKFFQNPGDAAVAMGLYLKVCAYSLLHTYACMYVRI